MGCFMSEQIDFYQFRNVSEFYAYLHQILKTDYSELMGSMMGNITMLLVNQHQTRQMKVFLWNQILMSCDERKELADLFYQFYQDNLQQLCYCTIAVRDKRVRTWSDKQIAALPDLLSSMEEEGYYPVFAQICAPDEMHESCYLACICVIDKSNL